MYNAYEATLPRSLRQKEDSPATAGAAKTPTSVASASKDELEAMAARHGWTKGPLTVAKIREMSSAELRFHEVCNAEEFNAALQREANRKHNREHMPYWNVRRMWSGHSTDEETAEAYAAGDQFARMTPRFVRSLENALALTAYMQSHNLDGRRVESFVEAFRVLSAEGKLELAEPESADAYYASHPELHETRVPFLVAAREAKAQATVAHFQQAENATRSSEVVKVLNYGPQHRGVPPQPDKASFRKRIESMTADEIRRECEIDPEFKAALDAL